MSDESDAGEMRVSVARPSPNHDRGFALQQCPDEDAGEDGGECRLQYGFHASRLTEPRSGAVRRGSQSLSAHAALANYAPRADCRTRLFIDRGFESRKVVVNFGGGGGIPRDQTVARPSRTRDHTRSARVYSPQRRQ